MSKIISIDSGSSYCKFSNGTTTGQFPAVIEPVTESAPPYPDEVLVDGTRYAVAETALLAQNRFVEDPRIERGFHGSPEQRVQLCYAFERLGLDGEHDLLVASLPYADHQDAAVRARVVAQREFRWQTSKGHNRKVSFREVVTTPQGVGALLFHRQQTPGFYRLATLIDIGSCTLDIVTIAHDSRINDYQFSHTASSSIRKISVATFKHAWLSKILNIDGLQTRNFGYHQLMAMPMSGDFTLPHRGDSIDLEPTFREVCAEFTRTVAAAVRDVTKDLWDNLDAILLTGGGAQLIDIQTWPDDRTVVLNAYANVRGQWKHAADAASAHQETKEVA